MSRKRYSLTHLMRQNRAYVYWLVVSMTMTLLISLVAGHAAYREKRETFDSSVGQAMYRLSYEYRSLLENFWQIYMPVFGRDKTVSDALTSYFQSQQVRLSPGEKRELQHALTQIALCDSRISWITIYSPTRSVNYILTLNNTADLKELPASFPFLKELPVIFSGMENLGSYDLSDLGISHSTFAICGGIPRSMGNGMLLVGYQTSALTGPIRSRDFLLRNMHYYLISNKHIIFSSRGTSDAGQLFLPSQEMTGVVSAPDGTRQYVIASPCGNNVSYLVMACPYREVLFFWFGAALMILAGTGFFIAVLWVLFVGMLQTITREVGIIRDGLNMLGENNLNYRIQASFHQNGLEEIANAVNHMATRLQENVIREKDYQLRQKEAELSDLQSKFNPHFLYNTLEMLRGRCVQSGNEDVAELIANLSSIFRSLMMKRSFISVREELAGSRRYFNLFAARYGERVEIQFDIASEVLQYGIIPNVLQPLIENYFQYGFDIQEDGNYIRLSGESIDGEHFMLAVEDNGFGMSNDAIEKINATLQQPLSNEKESYGLKNLHQRLTLYYGADCGVRVMPRGERGLRVEVIARKMLYSVQA